MRFEDYLMEEFDKVKAEEYGYADISDSYDHWVEHLEPEELMEYGTSYGVYLQQQMINEGTQASINRLKEMMKEINVYNNEQ